MFQDKEVWKLIVTVHNFTKMLLLKAEEVDPEHEFYYPPLIQQRDTLDHIVRAAFGILYPEKLPPDKEGNAQVPEKYARKQMDKSLGHAYRALFDSADWVSLRYRERIRETMGNYSRQTIRSVLPDYGGVIEPRIEEISLEIAELRKNKDIGNEGKMIREVERYKGLIDELEKYWEQLRQVRPELESREPGDTTESE